MLGEVLLMTVRLLHADHVLPGDAAPLRDAAIAVDERGTIVDCGPASDVLPSHAGASIERVHGVVFPGLVNAHAHLELSAMRGKVPGGRGFVPWVEGLITQRSEVAPEDDGEAIDLAVAELEKTATVAIGEITNSLAAVRPLVRRGIAGCVFHEVFGLERASVLKRVEGLRAELEERIGAWPSRDLTYAPAPHTLYTTHPDAVTALLESAAKHGARTSLHIAEHAGERRAIEHGDGPVPEWLLARARQSPEFPKQPLMDYAERLGALSPNVLLVHLTEARRDELDRVAKCGAPVVLCPRSNLYIAAKLPPLLATLEAGIAPALGTDSLASNTSLDVLAEAKALRERFPSVPAWQLVSMASWNGARALGRTDLGRISKGARPGVYAVDGDIAPDADASAFLLSNLKATRRVLAARASSSTESSS
jgi:cytosine/adenosine deaminase-related metal-dependent hydrolase